MLGNNTFVPFVARQASTTCRVQGCKSTGAPAVEAKRQIHVFSAKQQLDGCTAAIMNPIEGEQEPGGRPFRGGQKAISTAPPLFVCVCVCV